jgi:TolB protein
MVMLLFLLSGCNSFLKSSGGTILFISDRVQIEGSEKYQCFQLNNEIYLMDGNGNNIKRLTDTIGYEQCASFSPDGKKIVFTYSSVDEPNEGIYVMDADGKNVVRLSDKANQDSNPSWSPDGKWIIYYSSRSSTDGNSGIYKMRPDGSSQLSLADITGNNFEVGWI